MILNTYRVNKVVEHANNMNKCRVVELSLRALRCYDPDDYVAEINEIYNCIVDGKSYEDEPSLIKEDLITILENLTRESKNNRKHSLRNVLLSEEAAGKKTESTRKLLADVLLDY